MMSAPAFASSLPNNLDIDLKDVIGKQPVGQNLSGYQNTPAAMVEGQVDMNNLGVLQGGQPGMVPTQNQLNLQTGQNQ